MNDLSWVLPYRNDFLTPLFSFFSHTAGETFLMVVVGVGYWCFNKKIFRDLAILLCGTSLINILLKATFKVTRPGVEHLMSADYYSFPSGHAQAAAVLWLVLAIVYKRTRFWWLDRKSTRQNSSPHL